MVSTFLTSRTTFHWITDALAREWNPIDRFCRREAREFRKSAPILRTLPLNRRETKTCAEPKEAP